MLVGDPSDRIEVGSCGRKARAIDGVGVEIGFVIVCNQGVVAAGGTGLENGVKQFARIFLTLEVRNPKAPDPRSVDRDRRSFDPASLGIAEEFSTVRCR